MLSHGGKKVKEKYIVKHCVICCGGENECRCSAVDNWGPSEWFEKEGFRFWALYLVKCDMVSSVSPHAAHLCKRHYVKYRQIISERECCLCAITNSPSVQWKLVSDVAPGVQQELAVVNDYSETSSLDWLCDHCEACLSGSSHLCEIIDKDINSGDPLLSHRASLVQKAMLEVANNGVVYTVPILAEYRSFLSTLGMSPQRSNKQMNLMSRFLDRVSESYKCRSYCSSQKLGNVIFDTTKFSNETIIFVYDLLRKNYLLRKEKEELESSTVSLPKLRNMICEQASRLPTTKDFDYRVLIDKESDTLNEAALDNYFVKIWKILSLALQLQRRLIQRNRSARRCRGQLQKQPTELPTWGMSGKKCFSTPIGTAAHRMLPPHLVKVKYCLFTSIKLN